jgi:arylsulfatase A-like enzyme
MSRSARNVVVLFADQQRWDSSSIFGNPLDLTPNFDRLAMAGTHLYHCFSCQPVCGPARAAMQTGLYPTTTGCFRNHIALDPRHRTLAHHFAAGGLRTGYIGKWHLAGSEPVPASERGGYEHWLAANMLEYSSDAFDTTLFDEQGCAVKLPGFRVDALTDAAIRFIDDRRHERFFLFVSYIEPHHQNHLDSHPAGDGYAERYGGRWMPVDLQALRGNAAQQLPGYFGMVKRLDDALGRVMDALRSLGLFDDTAVLYTADHGHHFQTRNSEYKRSCHDASIRIPGMLHGGPFSGGGRVSQLVSLIDLPPTLLDAAGLPVPAAMQGRSIMPLLRGASAAWPEEVYAQISESQVGRAIRTRRWKYSVRAERADGNQAPGAAVYREEFLYDLLADPHELTNLAGVDTFAAVSAQLRERLRERVQQAGEPVPEVVPAPSRRGGQRAPTVGEGGQGPRTL